MDFSFNDYMGHVRRANPTYERVLKSSLHGLTEHLRKGAARASSSEVFKLFDKISTKKRTKYSKALEYIGKAAMHQALMDAPDVRPLHGRLGRPTSALVIHDVLEQFGNVIPAQGLKACKTMFTALLKVEVRNVLAAQRQVAALGQKLSGNGFQQILDAHPLKEDRFNPTNEKNHYRRAALWVCHASTTFKAERVPNIQRVLRQAVLGRKDIRRMADIDWVFNQIVRTAGLAQRRRVPVPDSPLPSDKGGRRLTELAIAAIPRNQAYNAALGCYLFGVVIRCHGFIDGNGRTARCLFALAQLREKGAFEPISKAGEDKLTGI